MSNTRLSWLPLIFTPAAGPEIEVDRLVLLSSSWPAVSVIVWGEANTVGSKVISSPAKWSARLTAPGGDDEAGLNGADVHGITADQAPLVGGRGTRGRTVADGRAAGKERHGLGRTAVVAQRGEQRVAADQVV